MLNQFYSNYKKDRRDEETPYKVITNEGLPKRFADEEIARDFFNSIKGRRMLSVVKNGTVKILAYKFR